MPKVKALTVLHTSILHTSSSRLRHTESNRRFCDKEPASSCNVSEQLHLCHAQWLHPNWGHWWMAMLHINLSLSSLALVASHRGSDVAQL